MLERDLQLSRQELQGVYASRSWRLSAPYRSAGNAVRRLKTGLRLARTYVADRGPAGVLRLGPLPEDPLLSFHLVQPRPAGAPAAAAAGRRRVTQLAASGAVHPAPTRATDLP